MCQKIPATMTKLFVLLTMIFLWAECASGSCLRYGHACWGAHGKRNGVQEEPEQVPFIQDNAKTDWLISKLMPPQDLRYYRNGNDAFPKKNQVDVDALVAEIEADNAKSEWEKILKSGNRLVAEEGNLPPQFLNKRSVKEQ
ncbi:hypothetical protein ABEB36_013411 [Hypothenemus hampei]|uniref:Uncharacterized protein n=1 Tax=Hypothenemus hampei TaxID=57062 RepID=A0ABD1E7X8_HYPHA